MTDTSHATASPSVDPAEIARFSKLSETWWDPNGKMKPLHRINPLRLAYIRDAACRKFERNPKSLNCLSGLRILDIGCGAGLLCEPLARLGAAVTGVDAAPENIAAAKAHAEGSKLLAPSARAEPVEARIWDVSGERPSTGSGRADVGNVTYFQGELASLDLGPFDLVTSMEVIEHVADKRAFVASLAARLAPGGLMVLSTPNRTPKSRLLLVGAAEAVGMIPRGTHHWDDFVTPEELRDLLAEAGLAMGEPQGIAFTPSKGLHVSGDLALNYIVTATHR